MLSPKQALSNHYTRQPSFVPILPVRQNPAVPSPGSRAPGAQILRGYGQAGRDLPIVLKHGIWTHELFKNKRGIQGRETTGNQG